MYPCHFCLKAQKICLFDIFTLFHTALKEIGPVTVYVYVLPCITNISIQFNKPVHGCSLSMSR